MLQPLTILQFSAHDLFAHHWSFNGKCTPGLKSSDPEVYLPGRNLMMLAKAGTFCALHGIGKIALGSLGQNPFPDATPSFFKKISSVISQATQKRIEIVAPYRQLKKEQVVEKGIRLKLPLQLSFSCLSPRGMKPCQRCNKCAEFKKVERQFGERASA
jgi:7-cyano-7-deazaguanine synthase